MCDQITNLAPQITAGNVKGMAIATPERSPPCLMYPQQQKQACPTSISG